MQIVQGDLLALTLAGEFDVLVHGCNCHCQMGRGIALSIKQQFPEAYHADLATAKGDAHKLGTYSSAWIDRPSHSFHIVNAYTQLHWRGTGVKADYAAIAQVMQQIKHDFTGLRIAYPKIGAGLAGGDWTIISALIDEALQDEQHTFVEYAG
jgi:O-acetyl-ADP-ribose deacetylase (regulator of RNase III)